MSDWSVAYCRSCNGLIRGIRNNAIGNDPDEFRSEVERWGDRVEIEQHEVSPGAIVGCHCGTRHGPKCDECEKEGRECYLPNYDEPDAEDEVCILCEDHDSSFCSCCGQFWGGVESFEFNNPDQLCDNCRDQLDDDND